MGLKKIVKKVGKGVKKAAPLIMAGLAAKHLMGRKQGTPSVNPVGGLDALVASKLKRNRAIDAGVLSQKHDSESAMAPDKPWYKFWKKGGKVAAKKGGRIRKQFGGALPVGGTARRDMRSGYYPSDMGMRGGPMYKKGGKVTGIAKRGFGRALMKGKK